MRSEKPSIPDDVLGAELAPDQGFCYRLKLVAALEKTGDRARYEALIHKTREVQLWDAGAGPLPAGVIVCKEHKHGRR